MPKKLLLVVLLIAACGIGFFAFASKTFLPVATTIIFHRNPTLQETNGHTNILLLGTGGANHDGPNLTDTIIFASLDPKTNTINLISIPRDLWVPDLDNGGAKINEAYADGQSGGKQKGLMLAKSIVGNVVGQPIHYGFRIDFDGFVKAVDLIGGIDVTVDNTLDDYQYPIEGKEDETCGHTPEEIKTFTDSPPSATKSSELEFFSCRYMHLHVDKGTQHMDGKTALEFVRSRHAAGEEGSDFARSRRQQHVIEAFRMKVLSLGILLNPSKLINLFTVLKDSIDTDIPQEDIAPFIDIFKKMKGAMLDSAVIDYGNAAKGEPGLLIQPPISAEYNYGSVLIPRIGEGNYTEIQNFVTCELTKGKCSVSPSPTVTSSK